MEEYNFREIEKKWRKYWEEERLYETDLGRSEKKLYTLVMFSYPSGDKLHIGHWYNYGPTDTWARFKRLSGFNVFEPMGYDAFGLPAENYAIKHGVHPAKSTSDNINFIRDQLKTIGAMYDWRYEIDTSSPEYYMWTQWIFLQLYHKGLAYRKKASVNWCPSCSTVLANEQIQSGNLCERCSSEVTKKDLVQWFFKITDYADRLLEGLAKIDWPDETKAMQTYWIGRSEGAELVFRVPEEFVKEGDEPVDLPVFTTRPDTVFGATYLVLAPEHPAVEKITTTDGMSEVAAYRERTRLLSEIDRTSAEREKTGVFTGAYAVNPATGKRVPIWISDYIIMSYGTGAIMAVPAHDERDFEFARRFDLPIVEVIRESEKQNGGALEVAYTGPGILVNSGTFSGMGHEEGAKRIVEELKTKKLADFAVNFKLRDWLISRQRYWGAPIPIIYCDTCGEVPVPEEDLPVSLPKDVDLTLKGDESNSPLSFCEGFVNTTCPVCGKAARRETDTMDTFVCSSWYFLRYPSPLLSDRPFDQELVRQWLPVDQYVGGREHAVGHLLYARFITMVLHDLGHLGFEEPFLNLRHQGTITNKGAKMSKSRGNVIQPEPVIDRYGVDTFRMHLMFSWEYRKGGDWGEEGIVGIQRFLERVWRLFAAHREEVNESRQNRFDEKSAAGEDRDLIKIMHATIKHVTRDLDNFEFNTAISRMMELVNAVYKYTHDSTSSGRTPVGEVLIRLNILLAPFAPHLAEELWRQSGGEKSVFLEQWPTYDESVLVEDVINVAVQINGKLRAELEVERDADDELVVRKALEIEKIRNIVAEKPLRRSIVVKNRIVNLIV